MADCPTCSADIEPDDRFCWSCGSPLATACPSCGSLTRPGAPFCGECGHSLRAGDTVEHRLVTAIYVDLVGSTALAEQLEAENLTAVVGELHEYVREEVAERQGSVGAFIGDGVLGVFGLPAAHEDDPSRAVQAARRVLERVDELNATTGARLGVRLAARVGVNTGDLLAPTTDDPDLGTLAGDVLNVAARLQEMADPGQILVSERAARSASGFRFDDLGVINVRGRSRPVHAYRVVDEVESKPVVLPGPFLGRTEAIAAMRGAFQRVVAEGRPHHVVVVGDAGVGKSRLVKEFLEWAETVDPSLRSLSGRSLPYGEDITYRPLVEILGDIAGVGTDTPHDEAIAGVAQLLGDDPGPIGALLEMLGAATGAESSPQRFRDDLRRAWRDILSRIADDRSVVLVIEDVHWAGEALLDVIDHIVTKATGPILVITPARPEALARRSKWQAVSGPEIVPVSPLDSELAKRLAGRLLARSGLAVSQADAVAERAGGNPFFMEELIRQLAHRAADTGHQEPAELPATIQGVVSARIDVLEPTERRVLQAASVAGRIFWPGAVGHLTGLSPEEVDEALASLEASQLIRANLKSTFAGQAEYLFQHSLIGESAYGRLARPDLARMHASLAEWLEGLDAAGRPDMPERLAHHTTQAYTAATGSQEFATEQIDGLRRLAVERLLVAAVKARGRGVFARARELAETALDIGDGPEEAWRAHEQVGLTHIASYDGNAAWERLNLAIESHLETDRPDPAVIARLAAAAVESPLRWTGTMRRLPEMSDTLHLVRTGLDHAGTDDSPALASLLTAIGFVPFASLEGNPGITPDEAFESASRARDMAERLKAPHLESAALDALMTHALGTGRIQQAAEIATKRLELVEAVLDPWEVGDTYAMAAWLSFDLGDYEEARRRADAGFAATVDNAPSVAVHTLSWGAMARVQTGEWDEVLGALKRAQDLLDPARRDDPPFFAAPLYAAAAMVLDFRHRTEDADRLLDILRRVSGDTDLTELEEHPHARWSKHVGPIYIRRGLLEDAAATVRAEWSLRRFGREGDRLAVMCDLVAAQADWGEADGVIQEARSTGSAYGLQALSAYADRLEGRAAAAARDRHGARNLLESAHDRFAELGDRWEMARTALDLGAAGVTDHLPAALEIFEAAGAIDEIERARALLPDPG